MSDVTIDQFLHDLGSRSPAPGGGAVAGMAAALATATGLMVTAWSRGGSDLAEYEGELEKLSDHLQEQLQVAQRLTDEDARAYSHLSTMMKIPSSKRDPHAWGDAVKQAIDVPMNVVKLSERVLSRLQWMVGKSNRHLASDLGVAAVMAEAAARCAAWNVRANLPLLQDQAHAATIETELAATIEGVRQGAAAVEASCSS
jgi:glutamate formiminotransferase/formiminotetrahydrofolate cyclodeaminase